MRDISRRQFIQRSTAGLFIPLFNFSISDINQSTINRIIIRSTWDASTLSGMSSLPLLYKQILTYIPQTEVILWPHETSENLINILDKNFTRFKKVEGTIDKNGEPDTEELKEALESSDLLLYFPGYQEDINWDGTSDSVIETASLRYCIQNNLAYVIYGLGKIPDNPQKLAALEEIAGKASLVFVTDPVSEEKIKEFNLEIGNLEYSPDPMLGFDFRQESSARDFLVSKNLSERRYLSVILDPDKITSEEYAVQMDKIRNLTEKWLQSTEYNALLISDKSDSTDALNEFYKELSADSKASTKIYDGDHSAPMIGSLLMMSRIISGNSFDLATMSIYTKVPVLFMTDPDSVNIRKSFEDIGMKDYIYNLNNIESKELAKRLLEINKDYLSSLLDFEKINENAQKEIARTYKDISKIIEKIKPREKSKKSRKDKNPE